MSAEPLGLSSRPSTPELELQLVTDLAVLDRMWLSWEALLRASATNQPTLSPSWLLTWWRVFGADRDLRVALFRQGGRLVGLAPLLRRRHRYAGVLPFRRLELLGSGEDEADEICSDYLGVVAESGMEEAVANALVDALAGGVLGGWDELVLSRMNGETAIPELLRAALERQGFTAECAPAGHARVLPLPASWDALLTSLPSTSRYFLKRSLRDFERWAEERAIVRVAETPADLAEGLGVLTRLHEERWWAAGEPSLFDSAPFRSFHQQVMPELLAAGALDLRWLLVDERPIAALYNIVWGDKVHFYQAGRALDLPKGIRPGVVLHASAIRAAIAAGRREYDFLAGNGLLKRQLAPKTRPLVELRAVRSRGRELVRSAGARVSGWMRKERAEVSSTDD
jgi:CelD/BcsL family acetyltransferase involved in cellulose biosynthesis